MLDGLGGTGMLSGMKYVNIDQNLPQIGIRQQQAMGISNGYEPAEMHRDYEPPLADMGWSQVKVDIDTYQSRTAYGYINNADFAKNTASRACRMWHRQPPAIPRTAGIWQRTVPSQGRTIWCSRRNPAL